jgi:hypothetical protein
MAEELVERGDRTRGINGAARCNYRRLRRGFKPKLQIGFRVLTRVWRKSIRCPSRSRIVVIDRVF